MIGTMIVAWILTWFNLDNILVNAINQILNTDYITAVYWLLFFIIGIIIMILKK